MTYEAALSNDFAFALICRSFYLNSHCPRGYNHPLVKLTILLSREGGKTHVYEGRPELAITSEKILLQIVFPSDTNRRDRDEQVFRVV